jgi:hypothetical protein
MVDRAGYIWSHDEVILSLFRVLKNSTNIGHENSRDDRKNN